MQTALTISLVNSIAGLFEDGVTARRACKLQIGGASRYLTELDFHRLRQDLPDLTLEWAEPNVHARPVAAMYRMCRTLENKGRWAIQSTCPHEPWAQVVKNERLPRMSLEQVAERVGPEIWTKLKPYQQVGVRFAVERKKAYIGDEMGTGKTLQSLVACRYFRELWPVLVVCPSSLRRNWANEIERWLGLAPEETFIVPTGKKLAKVNLDEHKFVIISYSLLGRKNVTAAVEAMRFQACVLDECHYVKTRDSNRAKACAKVTAGAQVKLLLSGTPFNYPSEMYMQLYIIDPAMYPDFFDRREGEEREGECHYARRYCKPEKQVIFGRISWTFKGYRNAEELNCVLTTIMMRRRKKTILTQLPPKVRSYISLDPLDRKKQKEITDLLKEEAGKVSQGPKEFMQSFRMANRYKIPKVVDFIRSYIVGDVLKENCRLQMLIFFHHSLMREALEDLMEQQNLAYFSIHGQTPSEKRQEYVDAFQRSEFQVGLLSITAAGMGLNLTKASLEIFTEILFGPDKHRQAEDRAHRLGQVQSVNVMYLGLPNTTDEINFGLIKKKDRESGRMLDGKESHMHAARYNVKDASRLERLLMPVKKPVARIRSRRSRTVRKAPTLVVPKFRRRPSSGRSKKQTVLGFKSPVTL